jgi:hypothetical protein
MSEGGLVGTLSTARPRYASLTSGAADLRSTARPRFPSSRRLAALAACPIAKVGFSGPCLTQQSTRRHRCGLTPRSTPTRSGRQRKAGLRYFVLCSHPSLTPPAYAGGVTSNVRQHKLAHLCPRSSINSRPLKSSFITQARAPAVRAWRSCFTQSFTRSAARVTSTRERRSSTICSQPKASRPSSPATLSPVSSRRTPRCSPTAPRTVNLARSSAITRSACPFGLQHPRGGSCGITRARRLPTLGEPHRPQPGHASCAA